MPAPEKTRLAPCSEAVLRELARLLNCYSQEMRKAILARSLLCSEKRGKTTIYSFSGDTRIVDKLLEEGEVRAVGIAIAVTTSRGLAPTLGLLSLAASLHIKPLNHYVVVREPGATLFLYGRDILEESVVELRADPSCGEAPLIVLDEERLPLGLGAVARKRSQLLIRNVLDAGWYLRSGV